MTKPKNKAKAGKKVQTIPKKLLPPEEIVVVPFDEKEVLLHEKTLGKPVAMFVGLKKTATGVVLVIRPIPEETPGPGRPPIDREAVLPKLIAAFKKDKTDAQACREAKISEKTFYRYMKDDEDFRQQIEDAQDYALGLAQEGIVTHLEKKRDPDFSLRFLERRMRARYALRTELTGEDGKAVELDVTAEAMARAAKYKSPKPVK